MEKRVLTMIVLAVVIVVLVGIVINQGVELSQKTTGSVVYEQVYNIPIRFLDYTSSFTWSNIVKVGTCDDINEDLYGFSPGEAGTVTFKPRDLMDAVDLVDRCKDENVLIEFACGKNMPMSSDAYMHPDGTPYVEIAPFLTNSASVYAFEVNCPNGCQNSECI